MRIKSAFLLLALIAPLYAFADRRPPVATVTVRDASEVAGRTFTLGEIATVTGSDAAFNARLSAIEVGAAPLAGLSRTLGMGDIIVRLRFNRIEPDLVELVCKPTVRVTRGGTELPPDEISKAAEEALRAARRDPSDGAVFEAQPLPAKMLVPPGKREIRAGTPRGQIEGGLAYVPVAVLVDGRPVRTIEVSFRVRRTVTVVVAAHALEAHAVLTEADVTTAQVELGAGAQQPLIDPKSVVGKRTSRQILQGGPILASALENVPAIVSGAAVTVQVSVGGVTLSTEAIAKGAGGVGDRIRVYVTTTRKELNGTVVDAKTVRVEELP